MKQAGSSHFLLKPAPPPLSSLCQEQPQNEQPRQGGQKSHFLSVLHFKLADSPADF